MQKSEFIQRLLALCDEACVRLSPCDRGATGRGWYFDSPTWAIDMDEIQQAMALAQPAKRYQIFHTDGE